MAAPLPLTALWSRHKHECRSVSAIVLDARARRLPGVTAARFGFTVIDEDAALAAMRKAS